MTTLTRTSSTDELRRLKAEKLRRLVRRNPAEYARQDLKVAWWHKQVEIAEALIRHRRVFVKAGNGPGKTFLAAGLVNWFYDLHPRGICLTTAPTSAQVKDVLWKEVRVQRPHDRRGVFVPKAPRMEDAADHFAVGYTASTADAFQGRHAEDLFLIFDEATGVKSPFWDAGNGMQPRYWLVMLNPTDTATRAYEEELKGAWHVIQLNGLDHPNVQAAVNGRAIPYPQSSLTREWIDDRIEEWCDPIGADDVRPGDFEFPPSSGKWFRPGPLFEARVLGRWPSAGTYSVWSEALWEWALSRQEVPESEPLRIGCDVARFGDDNSEIFIRRGPCALHHEWHNGWDTAQTAGRLKQLAREFVIGEEQPEKVDILIDDDGVGGGVVDQRGDFNFLPVNAGSSPFEAEKYPNRRSELWFTTALKAKEKRLDLSRLSKESLRQLRLQAMAPTWKLDAEGRREVEKKEKTKDRLDRSPDGMDSMNLAYSAPPKVEIGEWLW